jgi:hypothetical protein
MDVAGIARVRAAAASASDSLFLVQLPNQLPPGLPWRARPQDIALPDWIQAANLRVIATYSAPYGRRSALLGLRQ